MDIERHSKSRDLLVEEKRSIFKSAISPVALQVLQEDGYLASFVSELSEEQRKVFVNVSIEIAGVRKFGRRSDESASIYREGKSKDKLQDKWEKVFLKADLDPLDFMGIATTFAESLEVSYENDPNILK